VVCSHQQVADGNGLRGKPRSVYRSVTSAGSPSPLLPCEAHCLPDSIRSLQDSCSEFLIHAADQEGLQKGIDEELVARLGEWCTIPVTYAGGARQLADLDLVKRLSGGKVDLTIGSALDCFGGQGVRLADCAEWNKSQKDSHLFYNQGR
jgi:hypothetical protein